MRVCPGCLGTGQARALPSRPAALAGQGRRGQRERLDGRSIETAQCGGLGIERIRTHLLLPAALAGQGRRGQRSCPDDRVIGAARRWP